MSNKTVFEIIPVSRYSSTEQCARIRNEFSLRSEKTIKGNKLLLPQYHRLYAVVDP